MFGNYSYRARPSARYYRKLQDKLGQCLTVRLPFETRSTRGEVDETSRSRLAMLGPWEDSLGRYFSGQLTWRTAVTMGGSGQKKLMLDLGHVEHIAQVQVNGQAIGCRSFAPWRFDLSPWLEAGENEIRITIANTPANAFWQPDHIDQLKRTGQWNIYNVRITERCTPTLDGGLYGPITWLTA